MKGMNNICSINQKWVREPSPDPFVVSCDNKSFKISNNK